MGVRSAVLGDARLRRLSRRAVFAVQPGARRFYEGLDDAYQSGRWSDVVDLVEGALTRRSLYVTPASFEKLAQSYAQLEQFDLGSRTLERALKAYPQHLSLVRARAELFMAARNWPEAIRAWSDFDLCEDPNAQVLKGLPKRGSDFKWFDQDWADLASHWATDSVLLARPGSSTADQQVRMLVRFIETLRAVGSRENAVTLAAEVLEFHSSDPQVVALACEALLRMSAFGSVERSVEWLVENYPFDEVRTYVAGVREGSKILDDLVDPNRVGPNDLRVLSASRGSGVAGAVLAQGLWTEERVHTESLKLSRRDEWPEGNAQRDVLSRAAWSISRRFARERGRELGIGDRDLARAVFHNVKHELILKLPIDRIADEIARNHDGEPIFVSLPSARLGYLSAYPWSNFGMAYLYDALRRRKLPVYFVRFPTEASAGGESRDFARPAGPTIVATSWGSGLKPADRQWSPAPDDTTQLVVTSGMRSVAGLLERVDSAAVLNSGAPLKAFAYDRSFRQGWGYDVHRSVHPRGGLRKFTFKTETRDVWVRVDDSLRWTNPAPEMKAEATLAFGRWPLGTWTDLLGEAVMPYFANVVKRARALMDEWGTTDVHIGDYLYVEPALVAAVAAERDARIHVWPHSSNPVHVAWHEHNRIDSVRAITRSGVRVWGEFVDSSKVIHDPTLLVQPAATKVPWTAGQPLSLVLVGGRPIMRDLPILDLEAHEALYRKFFAAVEPLVEAGQLRVYFKPRGLSGENEGWLESVVGRAAGWRPVLEHPMRITLPNLVYGSISVGSTALIEGVSRGVPGLIVREGAARDYLALEQGSLPVFDTASAVQWLQGLSVGEVWRSTRQEQFEWLSRELTAPVDLAEPVPSE